MGLSDLAASLRDTVTATRVFGEPLERGGVTVIPVATVRAGMGGGNGKRGRADGGDGTDEGEGGGLGLIARPAGAYVIRDGDVTWQPAVDVNRIVTLAILGWVVVAWVVSRTVGRRSRGATTG